MKRIFSGQRKQEAARESSTRAAAPGQPRTGDGRAAGASQGGGCTCGCGRQPEPQGAAGWLAEENPVGRLERNWASEAPGQTPTSGAGLGAKGLGLTRATRTQNSARGGSAGVHGQAHPCVAQMQNGAAMPTRHVAPAQGQQTYPRNKRTCEVHTVSQPSAKPQKRPSASQVSPLTQKLPVSDWRALVFRAGEYRELGPLTRYASLQGACPLLSDPRPAGGALDQEADLQQRRLPSRTA